MKGQRDADIASNKQKQTSETMLVEDPCAALRGRFGLVG